MRATRVLETALYVNDVAAAREFYGRVLGLAEFSYVSDEHVFFRCGEGMLLLFNPIATRTQDDIPPHGADGAGHVAFAMESGSVQEWRDHLAQQGVAIEREVAWPSGGASLYFRDPDGNSLELATPATWRG